jgi:CTD small phosphatase-like protein 2
MSGHGSGAVVTDLPADETSSGDDGSGPGKQFESDLVVVLDMDECLIHSQFLSQQAKSFSAPELDSSSGDDGDGAVQQEDKYRQPDLRPTKSSAFHTDGEEAESIIAANCEYFRIHLPDGDLVHVNKRPNLDAFLADVTARFETHIFTAALDVYANPLLDRLEVDLGTKFAGRFYREHCILDPDLGVYVKDLGLILDKDQESASDWSSAYDGEEEKKECDDDFVGSDLSSSFNEGRVVLVDNNPLSFLANPSNGILVSNFVSNACKCLDLLHVLAWL